MGLHVKIHYWDKGLQIQEWSMFTTAPPCLSYPFFKSPSGKILLVKPLIRCAYLVSKVFFHLGLQNKFPWEKNMEFQRENMATSCIMISFDPIK
jgi:hypothetical protein